MKNIHLIAIGGAIMHNLAIALKQSGYRVSGSDDAIFDPAKSNLEKAGLLPKPGWDSSRISNEIDEIILGMHAKKDNPELLKAQELGIPVKSFPEFVAAECRNKKRVVVAGSHGKTTTTAMIMYALSKANIDFDYLVGSSIDGFELSVRLSDAPLVIIEGDEYLSSPLDLRSKFLWYKPHISIITGVAYDHINVFPTFQSYLDTFIEYIKLHSSADKIIWYQADEHLNKMMASANCISMPYGTPEFTLENHRSFLIYKNEKYPLDIIGEHNLQNLNSAMMVCSELGIEPSDFLNYMRDFSGAGRRMERLYEQNGQVVYRDFAHSPSKLQATTDAVKLNYKDQSLMAVFELHTFSSLNEDFLPYYKDCMDAADRAIVYFDPDVFEHKKMKVLSTDFIKKCFGNVEVCTDKKVLESAVQHSFDAGHNILLMSSGTFSKSEFHFNHSNQR